MALSRGVFHPRFVEHHQPVVASGFLGTVLIEREGTQAVWDADLGDYVGGGMVPLFRGPARVQKSARPTRRENVQDAADSQVFMVQIMPKDNEIVFPADFEWFDNDRVTVLSNTAESMMNNMVMYLHNWAGSTNQWVTSLSCRYNSKQGKL